MNTSTHHDAAAQGGRVDGEAIDRRKIGRHFFAAAIALSLVALTVGFIRGIAQGFTFEPAHSDIIWGPSDDL